MQQEDPDEIQVLSPKSAFASKGIQGRKKLKKKVSFATAGEQQDDDNIPIAAMIPKLPKRILTKPHPIRTQSSSSWHSRPFADTDSAASSQSQSQTSSPTYSSSSAAPSPKRPSSLYDGAPSTLKSSSWWPFSTFFTSPKSSQDQRKSSAVTQRHSKMMNPFAWVSSKLANIVQNVSNAHHGGSSSTKSFRTAAAPAKRPVPSPPLPPRAVARFDNSKIHSSSTPKRDSGISMLDGYEDSITFTKPSTSSKSKLHCCRFCGGTTMINPYRLCPECKGTGMSESDIVADIFLTGKRAVVSLFEWLAPSKPSPTKSAYPLPLNQQITSYPRTSFDSNSSGVRNPRSSLDPGPQSTWSQELDYRRVTKTCIQQKKKRLSGEAGVGGKVKGRQDRPVSAFDIENRPLRQILQTVEAPSEVGFSEIVDRHC